MTVNPDIIFGHGQALADVITLMGIEWNRPDLHEAVAFGAAYRTLQTASSDSLRRRAHARSYRLVILGVTIQLGMQPNARGGGGGYAPTLQLG